MDRNSNGFGLISAFQFLTIIPFPGGKAFNAGSALPFFPICGLFIGGVLFLVDRVASLFWAQPIASLSVLISLIIVSGALHLDGLADSCDGLYGQREAAHRLAIMKDSRIGAMGMVAVLCCLAVKGAGIMSLEAHRSLWLLFVPAYARAAVPIAIRLLPYGRPDGGTGHDFFDNPLRAKDFWALAFLGLISLSLGWDALKINLGFVFIVGLVLVWYRRKMGAVTGDMLGALIEVTEAGLFILASAVWVG